MAQVELVMPKMGESIIEATILKWVKQVGDPIEAEETVLEIATDKVDSEVPAPADGTLAEIRFEEGDVVPVGAVIALLNTEGEVAIEASPQNGNVESREPKAKAADAVPYVPAGERSSESAGASPQGGRFYSPLVLNIAREENIPMAELEQIEGSGRNGRVTKKDMLAYVKDRSQQTTAAPRAQPTPTPKPASPKPAAAPAQMQEKQYAHGDNFEVVHMDRMRKLIAENMVYSKRVSAHVTSFVEADVTRLVRWRNRVKKQFQEQYGDKLTFTPIFVQVIAKALRELPMVNISVRGDEILVKKDINIGIAVALPNDNLIVPVIRNADQLNLAGLAARVNDLARRARENKLKPDELDGGTYTVSNVGTFGNVMGTPVIMQPQVAIMATGAIRKMPAVVETEEGDLIAVRQKMYLSHSYDHRVVDGALGGRFVRRVGDLLEQWDDKRDI